MYARIVVRHGHVISMDPAIGDQADCDVLVEGGRIAAVGADLADGDAHVIDATGTVVLPGFVDTHRHSWTALLRGRYPDQTLAGYQAIFQGPLSYAIQPEDLYAGTLLGALEALSSGITTILDYAHLNPTVEHAVAGIEALRDAGIRAGWAHGSVFGVDREWGAPEQPAYLEDLRDRHFGAADGMLTPWVAFGNPYSESDWATAQRLGLNATVHACIRSAGGWPATHTIQDLADRGLLRAGTVYSHCCTATDDELRLVADTGGFVASSPHVEMMMGHGRPVIGRASAHGLRPTRGADVLTSAPGDMFTQLRAALAAARSEATPADPDAPFEPTLGVRDVLAFATVDGAVACGLSEITGTLAPGKQADLILVRTDQINTMPAWDPVAAVVTSSDVSDVDTVMVGGSVVKAGGRLVQADLPRLRDMLERSAARLAVPASS
jgi:5-methylthioadenosine/S-adenosylhomocysteine deaminase